MTSDPVSFSVTRFVADLCIGGVLPIVTALADMLANLRTTRLV
ncbi:hypothetical protein [Burkholderia ambifaria]